MKTMMVMMVLTPMLFSSVSLEARRGVSSTGKDFGGSGFSCGTEGAAVVSGGVVRAMDLNFATMGFRFCSGWGVGWGTGGVGRGAGSGASSGMSCGAGASGIGDWE